MARSLDLPRVVTSIWLKTQDPFRDTSNINQPFSSENLANRKNRMKNPIDFIMYNGRPIVVLVLGYPNVQKPYPLPQGRFKNSEYTRVASVMVKNDGEPEKP